MTDMVWIGANVTIVPGVTAGDGAILAAGAVLRKMWLHALSSSA